MATNVDLFLDANGDGLLIGGSAQGGALPDFFRNDIYNFRIRILEEDQNQNRVDSNLSNPSIKLGIGNIDEGPTVGSFQVTLSGPVTSLQIPYNATNQEFLNAISAIAGQVTVSNYGLENQAWLITAATANTALSFGGDSGSLFPTSSVLISTRRFPEPDIKAQQVVKLRQSPAVYANNFSLATTSGVVSLVKTQEGSTTANEVYRLTIGPDAIGGNYFIRYGQNSSTGIPIGFTAASVQPILTAVCGIGAGNISVTDLDGQNGFSIAFTGTLSTQNVVTALEIDTAGVYFAKYYESLVTMGTAELEELFSSTDDLQINPVIEIELTTAAQAQTLLQASTTIRKDLISSGVVIPALQESYYTKTDADSIFATIATVNLNYYTKLEIDNLIDSITGGAVTGDYYTKTQSDNRYPTTAAISASYYTKADSDSRYPTTAAISASYYTKIDSDNRYPTTASISASYYTKADTGNLFVEDSASNVSASSRQLVNSATQVIIDWQSGLLGYSGVLQVPTATTASGITISSILNITTQTVISGNLTVFGTISGSGISVGDVYTKTESDNRFVRNSTTGVNATGRTLHGSTGVSAFTWAGASNQSNISWRDVAITGNAGLSVAGASVFEGYTSLVDGVGIVGNTSISAGSLSIINGGITIESTSSSIGLDITNGSIVCPSGSATFENIGCENISASEGTIGELTVTASLDADYAIIQDLVVNGSLSLNSISASVVTARLLNVTSFFGMGVITAVSRFETSNAATINTSTAVTWSGFKICSNGNPSTVWVLAGTATAAPPTFLGYDEEVRKITRQVLHVLSQNYFGFMSVTALTYP